MAAWVFPSSEHSPKSTLEKIIAIGLPPCCRDPLCSVYITPQMETAPPPAAWITDQVPRPHLLAYFPGPLPGSSIPNMSGWSSDKLGRSWEYGGLLGVMPVETTRGGSRNEQGKTPPPQCKSETCRKTQGRGHRQVEMWTETPPEVFSNLIRSCEVRMAH